ncbi:hypothetical protein [Gallalistipes aquisgranensis]|uniref:hypothetical protein n=1 Tax=Gallalistipes aquisgranensis TaxID=2779358 RepID=UPI001CF8C0AC|nr:hypothetical protein [Gallalistipes aquisgranensis]MBE5033924.1 hypothetical protein [Gallalistipes aquisgranensis]
MEKISQISTEQNMVNNAAIVDAKAPQTTTRRRRSNALPVWNVIAQARPVFNVQLEKSNAVKLKCIEKFMHATYADADKFWSDFMEQVNVLLDSRRFWRECESMGCRPEYVAEHVVFLGSAMIKKVLKEGVARILGSDVQLYKERFTPEEANRFLLDDVKRPAYTPEA